MALVVSELQAIFGLDTGPFDKGLGGLKGKIGKVGPVLAGAAAVAGAGVAAALAGAIEKGRLNDKLAAQLNLSAPQAAAAGKVAGDLYKNAYGDSLEGVNGAVSAVMGSIKGMRDASSEDLRSVTASALSFAEAMDVDVGAAAVSAGTLVQTGLAKNAQEAFDLLTAGAQAAGPQMVQPLLDATNEYSKHFAMLGYDGQAAMSTLSQAASGGEIAIDKAGDAVKEFGIRATDLGDTGAQESLAAIGLSGQDMANDLLAGGDRAQEATAKIARGLLDVEDPARRAELAGGLFGTQLEDIGKENIPGFLSALTGAETGLGAVEGAAAGLDKTLNDNAATALEAFKRQAAATFVDLLGGKVLPIAEDVAGELSSRFGPALRDVAGFLRGDLVPALQDAGKWLSDHARVIGVVAGVIATIMLPHFVALGVAAVASGVKQAAGWALAQAGAVRAGVVHSAQVVAMVAKWVFLGAQSLIQGARMAAAWVIAMGPVGWVIAAVVGLVALVIANWDTIVKATRQAWTWVTDKLGDAWDWATRKTGDALGWVRDKVSAGWDWVSTATGNLRDRVVGFFTGLAEGVRDRADRMRQWVVDKVTALVGAYVTLVMGLRDRVVGFFTDLRDGVRDRAEALRQWVVDAVTRLVTAYVGLVVGLRDRVLGFFGNLRDGARERMERLRDGVVNAVTAARDRVVSIAGGIRDTVLGAFTALRDRGRDAFWTLHDGIKNAFNAVRSAAAKPVNFLINTVYTGGIKKVADKVSKALGLGITLPEIAPIRERAKGGYTPAGMTLVGEQGPELLDLRTPGRVYTARDTRAMQDSFTTGPNVDDRVFSTEFQQGIARAGSLRVRDEAPGFSIPAAARAWDGMLRGLSVRAGSGSMQAVARAEHRPEAGWLGVADEPSGEVVLNTAHKRSLAQRQRTAMHELGHVLGLSHPPTARPSAMKQSGSGGAAAPTAYDRESLAKLYESPWLS